MNIDSIGISHRTEEGAAIYYDSVNGVAGQTYPIGTPQMPVSSESDLHAICSTRGIFTVIMKSNLTIASAISGYTIIGELEHVLAFGGQQLTSCIIKNITTSGNLAAGSDIIAIDCVIAATTVIEGTFVNCRFIAGSFIFTSGSSILQNCFGESGAVIDMVNDGDVFGVGLTGYFDVSNLTAGGTIDLIFYNGYLQLLASCTGGVVTIHGDCILADASVGATVNDDRTNAKEPSPTTGTATENWQAAEADIVSIGANDTLNKLLDLKISLHNINAATNFTIRMYTQINGVERQIYEEVWVNAYPVGVPIIDATKGIHEVLRVTGQSDQAADNGAGVDYDYILEEI